MHLLIAGLNVFSAVRPRETTVVASADFASLKLHVDTKLDVYLVFRDLVEESSSGGRSDLNYDRLQ